MSAKRWDGADWVEFTKRKRFTALGWVNMSGFRWDGASWVPLWVAGTFDPNSPVSTLFNLDEAPVVLQPAGFDLTKDVQL